MCVCVPPLCLAASQCCCEFLRLNKTRLCVFHVPQVLYLFKRHCSRSLAAYQRYKLKPPAQTPLHLCKTYFIPERLNTDAAYLSGWDGSTFAHNHCIYYWLASRFLVISFFSLRQLTQQELSITVIFEGL